MTTPQMQTIIVENIDAVADVLQAASAWRDARRLDAGAAQDDAMDAACSVLERASAAWARAVEETYEMEEA
jgi:hypothetical protein